MAANTTLICSRLPDVQWIGAVVAANTTKDLATGTIYLVWTADITEGGRLEKLLVSPLGTNVATVLRVWLNNGSTTATAANNTLITNVTLAATTVSEVAAIAEVTVNLQLAINANYRVYVTIGTAVAAGFGIIGVGGKY